MNRSRVAGRLCLGDVLSRFIAGVNYRDLPILRGAEKTCRTHGNPVDLPPGLHGKIRVYADGKLLGIGEPGTGGRLWPKRLLQLSG